MNDNHWRNLMNLLACPDCQSDLTCSGDGISCLTCCKRFEVRNGIPVLLPTGFLEDRLRDEEKLAGMMIEPQTSDSDDATTRQWRESKREFWKVVAENIGAAPRNIVNVGCGYDTSFLEFQDKGHLFVNFDMIYEMLETLKYDYESRYCVMGDAGRLPFRENAFDCLTCIDLIHHECDHLEPILKGFCSVLKPGGTLFLEDANAWAMFQFPKSILLPKSSFRGLRSFYHNDVKKSVNRPADYEFPTNPFETARILERVGFSGIEFFKNRAYPIRHKNLYKFYQSFSDNDRIARFHNYHYLLKATKLR